MFVVGVVISTPVGLAMQSTMHSFPLAGLGIRSQTMGSTLRSHSSGPHLPHKTPLPPDLFIHFTFSYPSFFAQHPTKFHQFLHTLPHSSHEYSDFDSCLCGCQPPRSGCSSPAGRQTLHFNPPATHRWDGSVVSIQQHGMGANLVLTNRK